MKSIIFLLALVIGVGTAVSVESKEFNHVPASLTSREVNFAQFNSESLIPFWQSRVTKDFFVNSQGLNIHYAYVKVDDSAKTIVLSPGRVEGYEKYRELIYDLTSQGFSVFVIDHQGQGLSSRRLKNKYKGYVENFDDYVTDMHQFMQEIVHPNLTLNSGNSDELYLVSHSMGGAVGLRYIQKHPNQFNKVVFSSPMWGLNSGALPKPIAKGIFNTVSWLTTLFTNQSPYFFGGQDYQPVEFKDNQLTNSQVRYQYFRDVYDSIPELQLGSVTFSWIQASINALDTAFDELNLVNTPVLVFQAKNDEVIDNLAQDKFCTELARLGNACVNDMPIVIENAQHELFIESDAVRNQVLEKILTFLDNN